ncbi:hypothetical protein N0V82_008395 [Gnomoniopsis sp. IMI 355080]|nr:hypothetical protein N0V82_008395 [Gnomoniopsis sp. IMI 355080]
MDVQTNSSTDGNMDSVVAKCGTGLDIAAEGAASLPAPQSVPDDGPSTAPQNGTNFAPPQQRQTSNESLNDNDIVHIGTGYQLAASTSLSESELSLATTLPRPTLQGPSLAAEDETSDKTLEMHIRASLRTSVGNDRDKFLPNGEFDQIMQWDRVYEELARSFHEKSQDDLQKLTHQIWDEIEFADAPPTNRRKIFATLVCINKATYITFFIDEGLYDSHLPFYFSEITHHKLQVYWKTRADEEVQIHCFSEMGWSILEYENFQQYQWSFQAPYFEIMSDGKRKRPLHYRFDDRHVLPFVEDYEEEGTSGRYMFSGGYSELKSPWFAVKRLKPSTYNEEMFKREVATLKRLSGQNHAHLITLQATYFYRKRYHLLFRWADGNLRDYWEAHPEPSGIPRTRNDATWVASQWLGLARGLLAIHHCPPDDDIDIADDEQHDGLDFQRINGRHGDIKPENILFFNYPGPKNEHGPENAPRLVISDFGLTEFHRNETNLVNPLTVAMSPTYRPPEYDVSATISQSYDIWSLGCVLLEFIIWYLQGFNAFDQFSQDRTSEDGAVIREDKYFTIAHDLRTEYGKFSKAAVLKNSVTTTIEVLRQDLGITDFIVDVLDFIEQHMLLMQPERRASCENVVEKLESILVKALEDEDYCLALASGKSKHIAADLSMFPPSWYLPFDLDGMQLISEEASQDMMIAVKGSHTSGHRDAGYKYQPSRDFDVTRAPPNEQAVLPGKTPVERKRRPWLHRLLCGWSRRFEERQVNDT